jgi:glycosyltransferase involved in cell wall biosynthesis
MPNPAMPLISILIPTYNCAESLRRTLQSVSWAQDIVVVDSYSTDETVRVAKEYGARVLQRVYDTPSQQKNWALQFCQHNWVLQLDSDEKLEAEAEVKLRDALKELSPAVSLLIMPRKNHVLGKWVRYGGLYPDYQTRLFDKTRAQFNQRIVHEKVETQGQIQTLEVPILHYGMPHITKQVKNLDRYTRYEAQNKKVAGQKPTWRGLLLNPWLVFGHKYFYLQGFRDGWRGLFLAVYAGFYVFLSQAKLREMHELKLENSPA